MLPGVDGTNGPRQLPDEAPWITRSPDGSGWPVVVDKDEDVVTANGNLPVPANGTTSEVAAPGDDQMVNFYLREDENRERENRSFWQARGQEGCRGHSRRRSCGRGLSQDLKGALSRVTGPKQRLPNMVPPYDVDKTTEANTMLGVKSRFRAYQMLHSFRVALECRWNFPGQSQIRLDSARKEWCITCRAAISHYAVDRQWLLVEGLRPLFCRYCRFSRQRQLLVHANIAGTHCIR
ncbi:unnamed protein product [Clonostachys byssicola]|uniref:Uncharacterized protein n=1 Tax=Clonostachys byssicola TaxID=160290 RepID=A0A9N9UYK2_9HYPO|nr:unnamed protein product [Clonostachys byssicola]